MQDQSIYNTDIMTLNDVEFILQEMRMLLFRFYFTFFPKPSYLKSVVHGNSSGTTKIALAGRLLLQTIHL